MNFEGQEVSVKARSIAPWISENTEKLRGKNSFLESEIWDFVRWIEPTKKIEAKVKSIVDAIRKQV